MHACMHTCIHAYITGMGSLDETAYPDAAAPQEGAPDAGDEDGDVQGGQQLDLSRAWYVCVCVCLRVYTRAYA